MLRAAVRCVVFAGVVFTSNATGKAQCSHSEVDSSSLMQSKYAHVHDRSSSSEGFKPPPPHEGALCKDLSDGRLDKLAGHDAPFSKEEVGLVACNMAKNIFPNGTIIAAPSKGIEPVYKFPNGSAYLQNDYYYMWQRDAGLTMQTLLRLAKDAPAVQAQLKAYAKLLIEKVWKGINDLGESPNKNCAPWSLAMGGYCAMLGEAKYFVNGTVYNEPWGRLQNDGPALNALALMELFDLGGVDDALLAAAKNQTIRALNWIGNVGLDSTIDPWEMLFGQHFWVQAIQRKAMAAGSALAKAGVLDHDTDNFETWVEMLGTLLEVHVKDGAVMETVARPNWGPVGPKCMDSGMDKARDRPIAEYHPCELDMAVPLATMAGKLAPDSPFPELFPPHNKFILATAQLLIETMAPYYEVNKVDDAKGLPGALIGRYPGDEYSGVIMSENFTDPCTGLNCGNPWFLTTIGLAETMYQAAAASAQGKLEVDATNERFVLTAIGLAKPVAERGELVLLPRGPGAGKELARMLIAGGDGVLKRVKHHMQPPFGRPGMHMSEQIYRGGPNYPGVETGTQFGVRDLTWSYASLLNALASRAEAYEAMADKAQPR